MAVPYTFASATTSIPLANLDANFSYFANAISVSGTTATFTSDAVISGLTVGKGGGSLSSNTVVGNGSFASNTTGVANDVFGSIALAANTTGNNNSVFGRGSLIANTTGSSNCAFGYNALVSNTTASNNIAVGYQAGYSNTTGTVLTFVGFQAGYGNTTATRLVAVGTGALAGTNTGQYNVAVGSYALTSNTSGFQNTAVGDYVLPSNTTGYFNTAVGQGSMINNSTGNSNAALGNSTLTSNTTGSANSALGSGALFSNTTASNNTAVGYESGYAITTSPNNVMVGFKSGFSLVNSANGVNTFVGANAGYYCTNSENTFIGAGSGYNVTTGTGNTIIGSGGVSGAAFPSGYYMTTGSKNTIVGNFSGNQSGLDIRTASNYIVLSDGDGTPVLVSTGAGSLSVNNPTVGANAEFCLMRGSTKRWYIWNDGTSNRLNIVPASFSSGVYLADTATSWAAYSDRRIKTNIQDINYGLETILLLKPRRYTVISNNVNSIGFVAQELKEVLPEAVIGEEIPFDDADTPQDRSTKTMGITQDTIIPVLVKAIQELNAKVTALELQLGTK